MHMRCPAHTSLPAGREQRRSVVVTILRRILFTPIFHTFARRLTRYITSLDNRLVTRMYVQILSITNQFQTLWNFSYTGRWLLASNTLPCHLSPSETPTCWTTVVTRGKYFQHLQILNSRAQNIIYIICVLTI